MKNLKPFAIAVTVLLLFSCQFNSSYVNRVEDKDAAEKITNQYFDLLKAKKYDESFALFSDKFWTVTSKEKTKEIFTVTNKKLGALVDIKLDHWETRRVEGTNPSAEYILYYVNKYEKYDAKETLSLTRESDGKIKIIAFNINSEGFFK